MLDAAWAEIKEHGYGAFSVDDVAARAGTSKAVLYRRWPGRAELARAAIQHVMSRDPMTAPDTGSLRGGVIAFLQQVNERRAGIGAQLIARLAEFQDATGATIADLRETVALGHGDLMIEILDHAVDRGEASRDRPTRRIVQLPADLFRLELLMTSRPISDDDIIEIVDTIFLPLVGAPATQYQPDGFPGPDQGFDDVLPESRSDDRHRAVVGRRTPPSGERALGEHPTEQTAQLW